MQLNFLNAISPIDGRYYEKTKGFLTEYSMSTPSEDMAEVFSFLMTDKETIEDKINSDKILNNKVNFIKLNLAKIDKNIL